MRTMLGRLLVIGLVFAAGCVESAPESSSDLDTPTAAGGKSDEDVQEPLSVARTYVSGPKVPNIPSSNEACALQDTFGSRRLANPPADAVAYLAEFQQTLPRNPGFIYPLFEVEKIISRQDSENMVIQAAYTFVDRNDGVEKTFSALVFVHDGFVTGHNDRRLLGRVGASYLSVSIRLPDNRYTGYYSIQLHKADGEVIAERVAERFGTPARIGDDTLVISLQPEASTGFSAPFWVREDGIYAFAAPVCDGADYQEL